MKKGICFKQGVKERGGYRLQSGESEEEEVMGEGMGE